MSKRNLLDFDHPRSLRSYRINYESKMNFNEKFITNMAAILIGHIDNRFYKGVRHLKYVSISFNIYVRTFFSSSNVKSPLFHFLYFKTSVDFYNGALTINAFVRTYRLIVFRLSWFIKFIKIVPFVMHGHSIGKFFK